MKFFLKYTGRSRVFLFPPYENPVKTQTRSVCTDSIYGLFQVGLFFVLVLVTGRESFAGNKKINLKDVKIQGQGLDNSKIFLSSKDRTDIEKHLRIRKDFREEILSDLPPSIRSKSKKRKRIK